MKNTSRKVILAMQISLDGFIEGPNGAMDWLLGGDDVWDTMFKDMESVDTYLLGGNTYPVYAEHWRSLLNKTDDSNEVKFAKLADKTPHIVFSHTIKKVDWANTRIATDAEAEIAKLKQQPGKDMYVWGGATFAGFLINKGLVDEYRLVLNPTVLGGGKPLFKDVEKRMKLTLIDSRPLSSGVVVLRYR